MSLKRMERLRPWRLDSGQKHRRNDGDYVGAALAANALGLRLAVILDSFFVKSWIQP
ncbi:hypothetical protein [Shewanella canadensis]|uniref:hypothetical protein n=1 Tax=Shewanella canadensis TaxID=271096 RepID=UPI00163B134D|nr:hypothetical protein [Shewanella canadensis]